MYIINALIAYFFGIFLYRLLLNVYDSEVDKDKVFFDDRFRVQFFTVTLLASVYFCALYLTDMGYYFYKWNNLNVFTYLKVVFMTMPFMGWVLLIIVYYCKSDTLRSETKELCLRQSSFLDTISHYRSNIIRVVLVGLLTHKIVLIILSIFPTLLHLFAQPSNTFALLVIHVALFYTETMTGMLVIEQLKKYIVRIQKLLHTCKCCTCTCKCCTCTCKRCTCTCKHKNTQRSQDSTKLLHTCKCCTNTCKLKNTQRSQDSTGEEREPIAHEPHTEYRAITSERTVRNTKGNEEDNNIIKEVMLLIGVVPMFVGLGIVYVSVMWFYQVLFLRNLNNNLAFDIIIKYVPSAGIAAFGYLIQKGTFSKTKKEDKNEKLWLKLGELLNISDDDLNELDKAKKEKIVQLRNLCRQPLANNDQPNQDGQPNQKKDGQPNQDGQPKEEETNKTTL